MSSWDPFARLRRRAPQESQRRGIGGAADGREGGVSPPLPRSMNERIRAAHDDLKVRRSK